MKIATLPRHVTASGLLALWVSCSSGGTAGEVIPGERKVDWTPGVTVGVPGGIPTDRTHLIDVTKSPYHADNAGATDAQKAIQAAVDAASKGDVVYLPAGSYELASGLSLRKSGITIRGAGSKTLVRCVGKSGFAYVGANSDYQWNWPKGGNTITAGLSKGSTRIAVPDTSAFPVGHIVRISVANDPTLPVVSVLGFPNLRGQMTRVTGKDDTTLAIFPPLYGDYGGGKLPARVNAARAQGNFTGIEDMTIDCKQTTGAYAIWLEQCYGSWVKNVKCRFARAYHIFLYDCLNCEVRHCWLDELNHTGPNGAGLLVEKSSACLVEDNIVYKAFPHIEVNHGSSGNVFAYNFCENNYTFGIMGCSIDCNHGAHNAYDLYEGNIASVFQCDGYHGSASEITVFRNWFHATCDTSEPKTDQFGRCISLNRFSRNISVVGNILGRTGLAYVYDNGDQGTSYARRYIYNLGLPNMGNGGFRGYAPPWKDPIGSKPGRGGFQELDRDLAHSTLRKGNWNAKDAGVPLCESLGAETLPKSLFRSKKPEWFGKLSWPPFDPSRPNQSYDAIPAGCRFQHGADP